MQSLYFVPINQCGTKEEVKEHLLLIIELCKKNIEKYKKEIEKGEVKGWEMLIEHEKEEMQMLMNFKEKLN